MLLELLVHVISLLVSVSRSSRANNKENKEKFDFDDKRELNDVAKGGCKMLLK